MATSAQTITSVNSANVPISLRMRTDMVGPGSTRPDWLALDAAGRAGLYGPHRLPQAANHEGNVEAAPSTAPRPAIRAWLYAVAALMVLTLVVGGATRLTESGLSIVEWKPVTGVIPPLSQEAWQAEFGKYQQIPQYRELNRGMNLERVQDYLLVGVDASPAGAPGRRRVPIAVSVFSLARLDRAGLARRGCGLCSAAARCSARSAGGWCRRASPAASACRSTAWRST